MNVLNEYTSELEALVASELLSPSAPLGNLQVWTSQQC